MTSGPRRTRLRVGALALALAAVAAGCAGPKTDLDVGLREVPTDVVLGNQTKPPIIRRVTPVPPLDLGIAGPSVITLVEDVHEQRRGGPRITSTTAPPPCPAANPLAPVGTSAVAVAEQPPVEATYAYRNDGFFEQGGADAKKGLLPVDSTRTVRNVKTTPEGFTFDVDVVHGGVSTVTSYRVQRQPAVTDDAGDAGLFIARVTTKDADGNTSTFDPTPDLRLLPFPVEPGVTWRTIGYDAAANVGMAFTGTVGNRVRVDACGSFVDAWAVRIEGALAENPCPVLEGVDPATLCRDAEVGGQQVAADNRTTFRADYGFATQFGALSVTDTVDVTISDPISPTRYSRNEAVINVVPKAAGG